MAVTLPPLDISTLRALYETRPAYEQRVAAQPAVLDGASRRFDPAGQAAWSAWGGADTYATAAAASAQTAKAQGKSYPARGTGYFPENSRMEGGFLDRKGKPLHTLQDYLAGKAPFVSVAMDSKAFPYGTKLRIPELEKKYGQKIDFRVVDTGGAFKGKGTSRIDICTANRRASLDPAINGRLTLIPQ